METTAPFTPDSAADAPPAAQEPRRPWWRRADLLSLGALLLLAVWAVPAAWRGLAEGRPPGEVYFTGLDDSAQSMLARSLEAGAPLVYRDEAFASVPKQVRRALLYRPAAARKTRDLSHQLDPDTCEARPFFQPFLPWQRAHLPGLPFTFGFLAFFILAFASLPASGHGRFGLFAFLQLVGLAFVAIGLVPWIPRFAFGPFAEGPATIFAAFALVLAAVAPGTAPWGAAEGLCLGLAATFHPTLALYAVPVALFAVLRSTALPT
ncbi:MAG: hypothetical protein IJL06_01555 [Kiritimatiellae bacterium]|nr:hypothetical protein [Kiritimatiellia bacterium]